MIKKVIAGGKNQIVPVKIWTDDVDKDTEKQLADIARLPFIHKHVSAMPDVHLGYGTTIGSVIPTRGAVIPAAVGVDIGCGMVACKTSLMAGDLPDNLAKLRSDIERAIPHGRSNNGADGDVGAHDKSNLPDDTIKGWNKLKGEYDIITELNHRTLGFNNVAHLGTLGGGNHFIEICLDEKDCVWVMLHSGSRGAGAKIGGFFIEEAKKEMEKYHITNYLPNKDVSYLVENTEIYDQYIQAVSWAQDFARMNRDIMLERVLKQLEGATKSFIVLGKAINCHHNYIEMENHFNKNVLVTRKGAIRARIGDMGIIPGSMGDKSYIVEGLGEKQSFCSCSHGAGRVMSRTEAKRRFTVEDLKAQTMGIECPKDEDRIDEIPAAYKNIDSVMANQTDLVNIVATLKQVLNIKG